ncbi:hypothetical protein [Curtobacterium sp. MCBD17_040]|uniref:hypothetical protein n=1 Tax=Curtobacterium sp. MCBD17_040 TaxID=2175674 RepID=UPI000DAA8DC4|nr:hypothetical protein [Curtobacterium sp. MCBD17_040]WIB65359.1 hypothetical protein DEI94_18300 [Curtobacterium sp. MCBD17_040]
MVQYAASTDVSSEKSLTEIKRTVTRYGATHFGFLDEPGRASVAFRLGDRQVRFALPLPDRQAREFAHHSRGVREKQAADRLYEQAIRQRWRALALAVKAKLEAVESGIGEFDAEFYAYLVLPNGRTMFEETRDQVIHAIEAGATGRLMLEAPGA